MENKLKRDKNLRRNVRKFRIRNRVVGTQERPRLVLIKSLKYLYAQIINDNENNTIVGFSTLNKDVAGKLDKSKKNLEASKFFGEIVGTELITKGNKKVVFDRNGYLYHGKVKAFADAVRSKGIEF
jgi:large subunit ribosomal protein L18